MNKVIPQVYSIADLKSFPQWVCYSSDKVPFNPATGKAADCNDPKSWGTYETARKTWSSNKNRFKGLGFQFSKEQGITGVDLDKCIVDGKPTDFAQKVISQLNSYTEYSPSGTGVHIWVQGNIPANLKAEGSLRIEMYDHQRYFTVTGKHLEGTPLTIEERQEELFALYAEVSQKRKDMRQKSPLKSVKSPLIGSSAYGKAAMDEECTCLASCPEGGRNEALNRAAFVLGQLVAGGEVSRDEAENSLYDAASQCGLSDREIERTMRSGLEKGMRDPRSRPESTKESHYSPSDNGTQDRPTCFAIKDERVLKALIDHKLQDLYDLAPHIAEMDEVEQARIKLAARDVWKQDFPTREFEGLLRAAKFENERKKQGEPSPISAYDLMRKKFDPVEYAVPDILPMGLIILGGKQKIGKSWLDLNLGLAVATGGIALGKYRVKQGDVLYLALEDTERRLQDRISQLLGPGSDAPTSLEIETNWPRMDSKGVEALEKWIIDHPNARLIIIDPWVKVKPRVRSRNGETGYDADYEALSGIKELADKYKVCVLIQFHLRKQNADDPFDEVNATTGATACADGFVSIKRARGEAEGTLYASGRDYKEEVNLALSFSNGMWKVLGDEKTAVYYTLSQERRAVIDLLCSTVDPYGVVQPMMPKDIAALLNVNDGTMRKMLFNMKDDGHVLWREGDKAKGDKQGYVSLIVSPKGQQQENNYANCGNSGNAGNGGNDGNDGNGPMEISSIEVEDRQTVTANSERYRQEESSVTPLSAPVESDEGGSVTAVTTVTALPQNEPIPVELLQEYRDLYQKVRQLPPDVIAPHGECSWYVPDSSFENGLVSPQAYGIRLQALGKSGDLRKVRAGRDEMLRKLGRTH